MKNRLFLLLILSTFVVSFSTLFSNTANAISGSDFRPGRIIDDAIFTNKDSMNPQQIQSFLNAKVPSCDSSHAPYTGGSGTTYYPPFTCLKEYVENPTNGDNNYGRPNYNVAGGKSAAQIIWEAGQANGINPQVLIVLLQKEQGLVTDDWPIPPQFTKATGYLCPDTAPCNASAGGFFKQVSGAAWQFRHDFDGIGTTGYYSPYARGWNNILYNPAGAAACGTRSVFIESQATAVLYKYTPYTPNDATLALVNDNTAGGTAPCGAYGNRNFWWYFNKWFGASVGSIVVRTPTDPTYYLLTNNKRYAIPNGDILHAYSLQSEPLYVVSDSYINGFANGGMLGTLFTIPNNPTVFLADAGRRYGIASGESCIKWGLACGDSTQQKEIGEEILYRMSDAGTLRNVMKNQSKLYLMEAGKKRWITSNTALAENGLDSSSISEIFSWTNAIRNAGTLIPENGSFVKFARLNAIFAYDQGNYYGFSDYAAFKNWLSPNASVLYDDISSYNTTPPASTILPSIVKLGQETYLLDGGKRIVITSAASEWPSGIDGTVFTNLLNKTPVLGAISAQTAFREPDGSIYKVVSGTKRPFNSMLDFTSLGYGASNTLQLSSALPMQAGAKILAVGSAFKVQGSDTILFVGDQQRSYALSALSQFATYKINPTVPTLSATESTPYTYSGSLQPILADQNLNMFLVSPAGKIPLDQQAILLWGISASQAVKTDASYLQRISTLSPLPRFIASPSGTIFIGEGGTKRPISTYSTYKSLGGSSQNTIILPDDVTALMPTGIPY